MVSSPSLQKTRSLSWYEKKREKRRIRKISSLGLQLPTEEWSPFSGKQKPSLTNPTNELASKQQKKALEVLRRSSAPSENGRPEKKSKKRLAHSSTMLVETAVVSAIGLAVGSPMVCPVGRLDVQATSSSPVASQKSVLSPNSVHNKLKLLSRSSSVPIDTAIVTEDADGLEYCDIASSEKANKLLSESLSFG